MTVFFEKSSYTIDKATFPPNIYLYLSKSLETNVTVTVTDKEGTATSESPNSNINNVMMIVYNLTGNVDYRLTQRIVTIRAGTTRVKFSGYRIFDDTLVEIDESFDLIIDQSSLPNSVALGDPCETKLTIVDNDSK